MADNPLAEIAAQLRAMNSLELLHDRWSNLVSSEDRDELVENVRNAGLIR